MTAATFTQLNSCMVCSGKSLATAVDLGNHAVASRFPTPGEPDPPIGPLVLKECLSCGHLQLGHMVDPGEVWRPGYGYRSSVNETMRQHLQDIAHSFIGLLRPSDCVLDIGSNDGELLRHIGGYFPGVARYGIDPLGEPVEGATIINEYFGSQVLPKAKVITTVAMFYDVPDPVAFARAVARSLHPEGIWCLEVADAAAMWAGAWDGICHEHLAYYTPKAIQRIAWEAGLKTIAMTTNSANGGSFRYWFMHGPFSVGINEEPHLDCRELAGEIAIAGKALRRVLVDLRADGKRIMILGASTKGNTLLQSCLSHEAARHIFELAIDRAPEKVGRELPGSRIPIIGEDLCTPLGPFDPPDYFLVLPWHFRENILQRGKALWPTAKFIFPLPKLEII